MNPTKGPTRKKIMQVDEAHAIGVNNGRFHEPGWVPHRTEEDLR